MVTDVDDLSSEITLHCSTFIDNDDLELVEPADPKADFLSELKGLLEKYDAGIKVDFDQSDEIYTTMIYVGGDSVEYDFTNVINKYNVLDYKK